MIMKFFGACVMLLGLAMLIFSGMAYFELHGAATSETAPSDALGAFNRPTINKPWTSNGSVVRSAELQRASNE